ncbi:hypothetical protein EB001_06655, partial [bacterium]|nr:hypothetical protein [bacterium]
MASSLTKDQQLSAANAQYKNWVNQQIAANGGYYPTINQINQYKASILNTGLYPDLDIGVPPPPPGVDINVTPDQFFIVGSGGYNEDRNNGYTGSPIFTGGISDNTTLEQFTAAQDAYGSALQAQQDALARSSAGEAQAAQNALAAAQARVKALEAQLAADSPVDPTLTSSAQVQAASSAANQRQGQEISPTGAVTDPTTLAEQYTQYRASGTVTENSTPTSNVSRQEQLDRINDSYNATSSGSGTDVTAQTPTTNNTALQNINRNKFTDATEVSNAPLNKTNSVAEDNPQNGATGGISDNAVYTDQQVNGMRGRGLPDSSQTDAKSNTSGSNSVNILKSGPAYGSDKISGSDSFKDSGGGGSRDNKLHNYVNYTYRLSIYAVPRDTINRIYESTSPVTSQQILAGSVFVCSDSGKGQNSRSPYFPVDLTIDNLELTTIVNSNSNRTRGTDVIKFKFDIIEPYTVTFLARLQKLSAQINPKGNWSTMFFVLKIEFMGYTDNGQPIIPGNSGDTIPNTTKFIPFTMINMKFHVSGSGGKYTIDAIPPNGLGLTALDNQIPFHVEVSGTTLNELFNGDLKSTTTETSTSTGRDRQVEINTTTTQDTVNGNKTTVKKGLASALNANEKSKVDQKTQKYANSFKFVFDGDIGNTSVLDPKGYFKVQNIPSATGKDQKEVQQGKVGSLQADLEQNVFRVNPGTRITDFINSLMTVSQYMTSQYRNDANDKNPLKTWKIIPTISFGEIDGETNYYQRKITYYVKSYESYGNDSVDFGQGPVSKRQIVKTYKYIYGGDNRDVLEANVDFNMAFFELKNGTPANYIDQDGQTPGKPQNVVEANKTQIPKFFMPRYQFTNGLASRQTFGPATTNLSTISVQDLMEKLYDNRGDMIKLDFTIVGDPDWISQDYPLMNPAIVGKDPYLQNGSINFSNAVYFNFYFATPNVDYDDNTGLFNVQGNYSEFSGIYYTSMVKSSFVNGKFTQKLTNYRVRNQEQVQSSAIRNDSVNPNAPTATNNSGNAP